MESEPPPFSAADLLSLKKMINLFVLHEYLQFTLSDPNIWDSFSSFRNFLCTQSMDVAPLSVWKINKPLAVYLFPTTTHSYPMILDRGCSKSVFKTLDFFTTYTPCHKITHTADTNNAPLVCTGTGNVSFTLTNGFQLNLNNVLHCPDIITHLISDNDLESNGLHFQSFLGLPGYLMITDTTSFSNHTPLLQTIKINGLHYLPILGHPTPSTDDTFHQSATTTLDNLKISELNKSQLQHLTRQYYNEFSNHENRHRTFGHASDKRLRFMQNHHTTQDLDLISFPQRPHECNTCTLSKTRRAPFNSPPEMKHIPIPGEEIAFDVVEITPAHLDKFPYALVAIDIGSTFTQSFLMEHKDDSLVFAIRAIEYQEGTYGTTTKTVTMDPGELGTSHAFDTYLLANRIQAHVGTPRTPQMNGAAERCIQILATLTRSYLTDCKHPLNSWGFAWLHAVNIKNVLPVLKRNINSPIESISNILPRVSHIQPFGCGVYYYNTLQHRKLEPTTRQAIYLGFRSHSIVKLLDATTGRTFEHRFLDCEFRNNIYPRFPHATLLPNQLELTFKKLDTPNNRNIDDRVDNFLRHLNAIRYKPLDSSTIESLRSRRVHHSLTTVPYLLHSQPHHM